MMRRSIRWLWAATVSAVIALPTGALAQKARPAPPACSGQDILDEIRQNSPEQSARIDAAAATTINASALLWKIEGRSGPPSHLFGTVHLTDDRVNALPTSVTTALGAAKRVILEIADLSPTATGKAIAKMQALLVFSDGRSLKSLLTPGEYKLIGKAIEQVGMPADAAAVLKPWVITMALALTACERRRSDAGLLPLDMRLAQTARAAGVPVLGLETLEDQLKAMAAVPDEDQLTILKAGLKLIDRADDLIETMVRRYLARDLARIWPLQHELWRSAGFDPAALGSFQKELVSVRNAKMRDAALPHLQKGGTFIAVGALHLPGRDGLVEMLREAGYTVTPVE